MPRKKSVKRAAQNFLSDLQQIRSLIETVRGKGLAERDLPWVYDYAIIRLHSSFESLLPHLQSGLNVNFTGPSPHPSGAR